MGHAYSTFLADLLARYKRLTGHEVKFATGTDENSQKIVQKAAELGKEVGEYLDEAADMWKDTWRALDISYTDFIRTTQPDHHACVQKVLSITHDRGDIYQGVYEGYYCVGCEAFKKASDLTEDGKCPIHLTDPKHLKENNRFFKLSNYEQQLLERYRLHPDFCRPQFRFNEIISFVE
ncbi:MAG: class I tRNA ligase family protein [Candidatus Peribacteria bacterium]|nr:MAG: class I tRNA ligase family protein [Candidatus Peribacteria bacterium]